MALENVARFMGSQANSQPSIIRNLYIDYTHLTAELWPTFISLKDSILHLAHMLSTKGLSAVDRLLCLKAMLFTR